MNTSDIFSVFEDILGEGFWGGGGRRGRSRGADLELEIRITMAEAASGCEKTAEFKRRDYCDTCSGSGSAPGTDKTTCSACGGYGQVEQAGGLGMFFGRVITTCPSCGGAGRITTNPCKKCKGSGRFPKQRVLNVKIPAGIDDGQAVRVRGEGEPGSEGSGRGDLHCVVRMEPHPFLERHHQDLVCKLPISFTQATLGAKIEVPTLSGKATLTIPRGTQYGQMFRLAGLGMPDLRSGRKGDELVQVIIEMPKKLDDHQEELLRRFAETENETVLPESKGFFSKLMEYFAGHDTHDERDEKRRT